VTHTFNSENAVMDTRTRNHRESNTNKGLPFMHSDRHYNNTHLGKYSYVILIQLKLAYIHATLICSCQFSTTMTIYALDSTTFQTTSTMQQYKSAPNENLYQPWCQIKTMYHVLNWSYSIEALPWNVLKRDNLYQLLATLWLHRKLLLEVLVVQGVHNTGLGESWNNTPCHVSLVKWKSLC
jgi:hypothetical protein